MGDSFQYGDIIFLGLIAVFVALRLRAMLGRNAVDPREVWKQATREGVEDKGGSVRGVVFPDRFRAKPAQEENVVPEGMEHNTVIATGLQSIKAADPNFSTVDFLSGAKLAFEWVVQAFSQGNKEKMKSLLSGERFQHFAAEIDARVQTGIVHETTLVSVLATDITEAVLAGALAQVTVQFTTEQINVTRDKDNNITGGDPSAIEKVIDVWTFERDISSRDPNWKIIAT